MAESSFKELKSSIVISKYAAITRIETQINDYFKKITIKGSTAEDVASLEKKASEKAQEVKKIKKEISDLEASK